MLSNLVTLLLPFLWWVAQCFLHRPRVEQEMGWGWGTSGERRLSCKCFVLVSCSLKGEALVFPESIPLCWLRRN